ncbi:MAG: hypothetical protein NC350_05080 [Corallococcus sp.]|nr:hypothetical protein [Corallococcus sp.]
MKIDVNKFAGLRTYSTEFKASEENVVLIWYDNPPEPDPAVTLEKSYYDNSRYTLKVAKQTPRKAIGCACVTRLSVNNYKVTLYAERKSGLPLISFATFAAFKDVYDFIAENTRELRK